MATLASLLPIALIFAFIACSVKVAARLLRRTVVSWKHSVLFGVFLAALTIAKSASGLLFSSFMPPLVALLFGLTISITFGAWYFRTRALTVAGAPLGWQGGLQLSALAVGLLVAVGFFLLLLLNAFLPAQP